MTGAARRNSSVRGTNGIDKGAGCDGPGLCRRYRGSSVSAVDSGGGAVARRQHGLVARRSCSGWAFPRERSGAGSAGGCVGPSWRLPPRGRRSHVEARELAAVLAVGGDAALSHHSAAYLSASSPTQPVWRRSTSPPTPLPTTATGIAVHSSRLEPTEMLLDGVRVTSVDRTLLDLAALTGGRDLSGPSPRRSPPSGRPSRGCVPTRLGTAAATAPAPPTRSTPRPDLAHGSERRRAPPLVDPDSRISPIRSPTTPWLPSRSTSSGPKRSSPSSTTASSSTATRSRSNATGCRDARLAAEHGIQVLRVTWRQVTLDRKRLADPCPATYGRRREARG